MDPREANAALETIERARLQVIERIDVPAWYWWGLALGWVGLGLITDLGPAWLGALATLAFGAAHASVAPRVVSGRHASRDLSVRADVAGPHVARLVIGGLLVLAGLTVALSLLAMADGARHPVTAASLVVAVILVLGGPRLLGAVRRRAARRAEQRTRRRA